jgi:hypothetical protein
LEEDPYKKGSGGDIMKYSSSFKKTFWLCLFVATALAIPAAPLFAEEEKPTGDFTTTVLSQYVWRGYELSRNSAVIQPSMTIGYQGFSANLWGNLDTAPYFAGSADTRYSNTWNETDLTVSYTKSLGLFNVGGGCIFCSAFPMHLN